MRNCDRAPIFNCSCSHKFLRGRNWCAYVKASLLLSLSLLCLLDRRIQRSNRQPASCIRDQIFDSKMQKCFPEDDGKCMIRMSCSLIVCQIQLAGCALVRKLTEELEGDLFLKKKTETLIISSQKIFGGTLSKSRCFFKMKTRRGFQTLVFVPSVHHRGAYRDFLTDSISKGGAIELEIS